MVVHPSIFAFGSFFPLPEFSINLGINDAEEQIFFVVFINCFYSPWFSQIVSSDKKFMESCNVVQISFDPRFTIVHRIWMRVWLCFPPSVVLWVYLLPLSFYNLLWWLQSIRKQHPCAKASSCDHFFFFHRVVCVLNTANKHSSHCLYSASIIFWDCTSTETSPGIVPQLLYLNCACCYHSVRVGHFLRFLHTSTAVSPFTPRYFDMCFALSSLQGLSTKMGWKVEK